MGISGAAGDMNSGGEDEWDAPIVAEINITPLTDIFLVLLIIFMVTSSVLTQSGMDVDLPASSQESSATQPEGVIVSLLPDGKMKVNEVAVSAKDWTALKAILEKSFKVTKSRLVILEGDRKAFLGNAIELMDHARKAGAQSFAIATQPDSGT